jgi:tetratricopeptide (TPR) repeat protein
MGRRLRPSSTTCLTLALAAGCWLLSAVRAEAQNTAALEGSVRTDQGRTIPSGVQIRLETEDGQVAASVPANSDGRFEIPGLLKTHYRLIVTAEGFRTHEERVDLGTAANQVMVDIFLSPAMKTKVEPSPLSSRTDANASRQARKEYEKGTQAFTKHKLSDAQAHFEKAIAEYPCYARAQADLGMTLAAQHHPDRAEAPLAKAIACDPDYLESYGLLADVYNAEKRFTESAQVTREGLRRAPNTWQLHYQLAVAQFGLGKLAPAEDEFQKVLSLNPQPPAQFHVKLADLYLKKNAYHQAYAEMRAYLQAEPDGPFAAKIKHIMQEMESAGVLQARQTPSPNSLPPKP